MPLYVKQAWWKRIIVFKAYSLDTNLAFAGSSGILAGWGIEISGRFEAERPPASAGPPSGGRAANNVPYV